MITFQYISLHVIVTIFLFVFCSLIKKTENRNYWNVAIFPITIFTLEEGLRWGRGCDWCLYYEDVYKTYLLGEWTNHELVFQLTWKLFANFDLPYYVVICFCSFLYIFSLFHFFKNYKQLISLALPMTVLWTSCYASNLIRWYMALSFVILGLSYHIQSSEKKAIVFTVLGCLYHYGFIIIVPFLYYLVFKKNIILKPIYVISCTLVISVFFNTSILNNFTFVFDYFSFFERFQTYQENASDWITRGRSGQDILGPITTIRKNIPYYIVIYFFYKYVKKNKDFIWMYNMTTAYVFIDSVSTNLELLVRYTVFFIPLFCLVFTIVVKNYIRIKQISRIKVLIPAFFCFWFFCTWVYSFSKPLEHELTMGYVWNEQPSPFYIKDVAR